MKETDFCPKCKYYLYLDQVDVESEDKASKKIEKTLRRICRNCGYQHQDQQGGLILEIDLKEKTSEGYKILMNEFTKNDPTLPHVNTIKCPNVGCETNISGKEKDVIYIKYDAVNLLYLYICDICGEKWHSRERN